MKNQIMIVLVAVACVAGSCCPECPEDKTETAEHKRAALVTTDAYPDEARLTLSKHVVNRKFAKLLIDSCRKYVTNQDYTPFDSLIVTIDSAHFSTLRNGLLGHLTDCGLVATDNFLTAVRVHFGLQNKRIRLFFQPVLLCKKRVTYDPDYQLQGDFEVAFEGGYYEPAAGGFTPANPTAFMQKYVDSVKIIHKLNTDNYEPHNRIQHDVTADPTAIVFTFQEIRTIFMENEGCAAMMIYNAIRKIPYGADTLVKHSLLLATDNVHRWKAVESFYRNYGNLGHLCPPSCGFMIYRLRY